MTINLAVRKLSLNQVCKIWVNSKVECEETDRIIAGKKFRTLHKKDMEYFLNNSKYSNIRNSHRSLWKFLKNYHWQHFVEFIRSIIWNIRGIPVFDNPWNFGKFFKITREFFSMKLYRVFLKGNMEYL